ncbi:MAG: nucleotide exchange factor GrpE [Treponema sp.]|nr:nucleotide exchange factor GrpE [Treponema sp.]
MSKHHAHNRQKEEKNAAENGQDGSDPGQNSDETGAAGVETPINSGVGTDPAAGGAAGDAQNTARAEQGAQDGRGQQGESCSGAKIARLEAELADISAKLAEAKGDYLRKAADFENFRKRMNQEKQNAIDFANQSLLLDLIPVIDDFERALQSAETSRDFAGLRDGIGMIEKRLISQLESKWGLKRFDSAGEPFDPNRHEALMMEKSPDVGEPVVQEELLKGYMLKDRVIRSAKVKVVMPSSADGEDSGANPSPSTPN